MTERVTISGLQIDSELVDFVANEAVKGVDVSAEQFLQACASVLTAHKQRNKDLLAKREKLQSQIDAWHKERHGQAHDAEAYKAFLSEIGYLVP